MLVLHYISRHFAEYTSQCVERRVKVSQFPAASKKTMRKHNQAHFALHTRWLPETAWDMPELLHYLLCRHSTVLPLNDFSVSALPFLGCSLPFTRWHCITISRDSFHFGNAPNRYLLVYLSSRTCFSAPYMIFTDMLHRFLAWSLSLRWVNGGRL